MDRRVSAPPHLVRRATGWPQRRASEDGARGCIHRRPSSRPGACWHPGPRQWREATPSLRRERSGSRGAPRTAAQGSERSHSLQSPGFRFRHTRRQRCHVPALRLATLRLRPHHDQATDRHERTAQPYPHHERVEREAYLGGFRTGHSHEHQVHVLAPGTENPDFGARLEGRIPEGVHVLALLADERALPLAVALPVERLCSSEAVQRLVNRPSVAREAPLVAIRVCCSEALARFEVDVELLAECHSGETREQHDHTKVDHVATVPATVASDEAYEGA